MKILILGGTGLLGQTVTFYLLKNTNWNIISSYRDSQILEKLKVKEHLLLTYDISKKSELKRILSLTNPDVVINCSAFLKINETNKIKKAIEINSNLPLNLLKASRDFSFTTIHFSTDGVFNGLNGNYVENDVTILNDIYALTKYLGELSEKNFFFIITSIIGHDLFNNRGLLNWFLSSNEDIYGYKNYLYSGTTTLELSKVIKKVISKYLNHGGLYHFSGEKISKYNLLMTMKNIYNKQIKIKPVLFPKIDRTLNSSKFNNKFNYSKASWNELLIELKNDRLENLENFFK